MYEYDITAAATAAVAAGAKWDKRNDSFVVKNPACIRAVHTALKAAGPVYPKWEYNRFGDFVSVTFRYGYEVAGGTGNHVSWEQLRERALRVRRDEKSRAFA